MLVVGNLWDPATNYRGARRAAALLPGSRLLTSDSWGHTAFGSSACVDRTVVQYLLRQVVPEPGARCTGDVQPFQDTAAAAARTADRGSRPPVVPLVPPGWPAPARGRPASPPPRRRLPVIGFLAVIAAMLSSAWRRAQRAQPLAGLTT